MLLAEIEKNLLFHLSLLLPNHPIKEVYFYATTPAGKLFRPNLVWKIASDLNPDLYLESQLDKFSPHALLATSVELHHAYSLLHDDLPCMDNDQLRRGKPCTHLAFNEWQALLAGDGLINLSYQLLLKSKHPRTLELMRFFSWALGPKGLIHGQVLDLGKEMSLSFQNTLRTHELKTARLIQVSILGSSLFSSLKPSNETLKRDKLLWKFSKLLGINFQLIDDLSELSEEILSPHEADVNPWILFPLSSFQELSHSLLLFQELAQLLSLTNTNLIIKKYYYKMSAHLLEHEKIITIHLNKKEKIDLGPIIFLLNQFC